MGIKKQMLGQISIISDFSYAWVVIYDYLELLQKTISEKPKSVLMLKAVFIKLSTIMEKPLMRILQAGSPDITSVSKFYSGQLFKFVKATLYVIPVNIFKQLAGISQILSTYIPELETRISKETLAQSSQPEQRFLLAEKTQRITMFTEGMLVLDKVLMGVTEIEPKEILIDGLRKELCLKIAKMLHEEFIFKANEVTSSGIDHSKQGAMGEFGVYEAKFLRLKANFVGMKRSIEYIQDFLNVQGEKIWREELQNVVENAVEREATRLVNKKYNYNDDDILNRPEFDPVDTEDQTFMGRLLRNILAQLDRGFYLDNFSSWYGADGKQVFGLRYINFLHEHLGTIFLQGLDKLIVYNLVASLRRIFSNYGLFFGGGNITVEMKKKFEKKEALLFIQEIKKLDDRINGNFESLELSFLTDGYMKLLKQMPQFMEVLMQEILTVGKLQILRRSITKQIHFMSKVECSQYESCLSTLNTTVLNNL